MAEDQQTTSDRYFGQKRKIKKVDLKKCDPQILIPFLTEIANNGLNEGNQYKYPYLKDRSPSNPTLRYYPFFEPQNENQLEGINDYNFTAADLADLFLQLASLATQINQNIPGDIYNYLNDLQDCWPSADRIYASADTDEKVAQKIENPQISLGQLIYFLIDLYNRANNLTPSEQETQDDKPEDEEPAKEADEKSEEKEGEPPSLLNTAATVKGLVDQVTGASEPPSPTSTEGISKSAADLTIDSLTIVSINSILGAYTADQRSSLDYASLPDTLRTALFNDLRQQVETYVYGLNAQERAAFFKGDGSQGSDLRLRLFRQSHTYLRTSPRARALLANGLSLYQADLIRENLDPQQDNAILQQIDQAKAPSEIELENVVRNLDQEIQQTIEQIQNRTENVGLVEKRLEQQLSQQNFLEKINLERAKLLSEEGTESANLPHPAQPDARLDFEQNPSAYYANQFASLTEFNDVFTENLKLIYGNEANVSHDQIYDQTKEAIASLISQHPQTHDIVDILPDKELGFFLGGMIPDQVLADPNKMLQLRGLIKQYWVVYTAKKLRAIKEEHPELNAFELKLKTLGPDKAEDAAKTLVLEAMEFKEGAVEAGTSADELLGELTTKRTFAVSPLTHRPSDSDAEDATGIAQPENRKSFLIQEIRDQEEKARQAKISPDNPNYLDELLKKKFKYLKQQRSQRHNSILKQDSIIEYSPLFLGENAEDQTEQKPYSVTAPATVQYLEKESLTVQPETRPVLFEETPYFFQAVALHEEEKAQIMVGLYERRQQLNEAINQNAIIQEAEFQELLAADHLLATMQAMNNQQALIAAQYIQIAQAQHQAQTAQYQYQLAQQRYLYNLYQAYGQVALLDYARKQGLARQQQQQLINYYLINSEGEERQQAVSANVQRAEMMDKLLNNPLAQKAVEAAAVAVTGNPAAAKFVAMAYPLIVSQLKKLRLQKIKKKLLLAGAAVVGLIGLAFSKARAFLTKLLTPFGVLGGSYLGGLLGTFLGGPLAGFFATFAGGWLGYKGVKAFSEWITQPKQLLNIAKGGLKVLDAGKDFLEGQARGWRRLNNIPKWIEHRVNRLVNGPPKIQSQLVESSKIAADPTLNLQATRIFTPQVLNTVGISAFATLTVIHVSRLPFLANFPYTGVAGDPSIESAFEKESKYARIEKSVQVDCESQDDPENTCSNPSFPVTAKYRIKITPKGNFTINLTDIRDEIDVFHNADAYPNGSVPIVNERTKEMDDFNIDESELTIEPGQALVIGYYEEIFDEDYNHAIIRNKVDINFLYDNGQGEQGIDDASTYASLRFGDYPEGLGCWPTSGSLTQGPYMDAPSHATADAYDIAPADGLSGVHPIYSSWEGEVCAGHMRGGGWSELHDDSGYGEHVSIKTIIDGEQYVFIYAHFAKGTAVVSSGCKPVHPGDIIGMMGSTGWSTGTHLHFERMQGFDNSFSLTELMPDGQTLDQFPLHLNVEDCFH